MGLGCDYTLCCHLPALPDWLSGDCVAVVHDLGLTTHCDEEGEGDEGVTMVSWGSRGVLRLDFAGEGIAGTAAAGTSGRGSKPSRTPA